MISISYLQSIKKTILFNSNVISHKLFQHFTLCSLLATLKSVYWRHPRAIHTDLYYLDALDKMKKGLVYLVSVLLMRNTLNRVKQIDTFSLRYHI